MILQALNFTWNWQFSFFRPNFPKKGISSLKQMQGTPQMNSAYSNKSRYQINSDQAILNFWTKYT